MEAKASGSDSAKTKFEDVPIKMEPIDEDDDINPSEFTFENEALALKGNKDYLRLMKTLCILQAQREQTLRDLDTLAGLEEEVKTNPGEFLEKLQRGEKLECGGPQVLPEVPEINWSKYKVALPPEALRPQTRNLGQRSTEVKEDVSDVVKVRGRVYDESKPVTFNQLWTVEEQIQLEELLVKYPPEENETKRYTKIAKELGNRTVTQVTSRCQKYFRKLLKAGLPVPGRVPKTSKSEYFKNPKYANKGHSKNNHFLYPRSTFFPTTNPPVLMDGDESQGSSILLTNIKQEVVDEDELSAGGPKLVLLGRIKKELMENEGRPLVEHLGYMCNGCNESPLVGTRWHCTTCDTQDSFDFCSDCLIALLDSPTPQHPVDHNFQPIIPGSYDQDYSAESYFNGPGSYNYLDPNFMPE